ncbi:HNH endonuclease [Pseudomonas sichuanensis]|uniref:HNH endonuclease n=1 Tax=Pseudomonas sichuanensis TaxID=2213015 RepID=UPI000DA64E19|nr:HNH endonuclease [Pseudomonas sichuanensis]
MKSLAVGAVEKKAIQRLINLVANNSLDATKAWTCFSSPRAALLDKDQKPLQQFSKLEQDAYTALKKRVVQRLENTCSRACAYCRRPVGNYGYGWHIEHVYPKASFPEQAFDLSNLAIGCVDCNKWKAARVDRETGKTRALQIINPCADRFRYGQHLRLLHVATESFAFVKYMPLTPPGTQTYDLLEFAMIERSTIIDSINQDLAALHRKINDFVASADGVEQKSEMSDLLLRLKQNIYTYQ